MMMIGTSEYLLISPSSPSSPSTRMMLFGSGQKESREKIKGSGLEDLR